MEVASLHGCWDGAFSTVVLGLEATSLHGCCDCTFPGANEKLLSSLAALGTYYGYKHIQY